MSPGPPPQIEIRIGLATCGVASGAREVKDAIAEALSSAGGADIRVKAVGCSGMCSREPMVEVVAPDGTSRLYGTVDADVAADLARESASGGPVAWARSALRLVFDDRGWIRPADHLLDLVEGPAAKYRSKQVRIVMENCGEVDPFDIDDYIARDGYKALEACLKEHSPEYVIEIIDASGLRGRGGAGFPTARKWRFGRAEPGDEKYVICNADEGDPGAFMDRLVLESDPHRVIEGLIIAAYCVGAKKAYIYVRAEYPIAVQHMRAAIGHAEERGYIGDDVLGSGFSIEFEVREGAGAFVCGEETALIASIEGERGMPRFRPPYPTTKGLFGRPTVINNAETLACVPWIIRRGADEFAKYGTETSKGTKVFALAGKIRRGGLIEVPMGITIGEIVEHVGGGIKNDLEFKAVQIGGPSGGCLPASMADTAIDFEALTGAGAMMGSGGLVVLDETDCMVDVARFFLEFTQNESCGKCTFCRIGTKRMLEILERLCCGEGKKGDIERLEDLADRVRRTSLCGLGKTSPNPVLTTIRYFRDEYEAHIEGRCPAGSCKELVSYNITDDCMGCTLCAQDCPVDAIAPAPYKAHEIDDEKCVRCGSCKTVCPQDAVEIVPRKTPGKPPEDPAGEGGEAGAVD